MCFYNQVKPNVYISSEIPSANNQEVLYINNDRSRMLEVERKFDLLQQKYDRLRNHLNNVYFDQNKINCILMKEMKEQIQIVTKELQPIVNELKHNQNSPIIRLLMDLQPGTRVKNLTIKGLKVDVSVFVNYDKITNLSTFLSVDRDIMVIDSNKIDSLTFG